MQYRNLGFAILLLRIDQPSHRVAYKRLMLAKHSSNTVHGTNMNIMNVRLPNKTRKLFTAYTCVQWFVPYDSYTIMMCLRA